MEEMHKARHTGKSLELPCSLSPSVSFFLLIHEFQEILFCCPFMFLEAICIPWLMVPFLSSRSAPAESCHITSLWPYWAHLHNPGSSIILGQSLIKFNLIYKLKSPLPCKVTYTYVPEIQMWTSLEGHYYARCNIDNECLIIGLLIILHRTLGRWSEPNDLKLMRQEVLCV